MKPFKIGDVVQTLGDNIGIVDGIVSSRYDDECELWYNVQLNDPGEEYFSRIYPHNELKLIAHKV